MTRRCETCAHWTAFTHEGEVVESIQGTCRESPAKFGNAADDWCGRWSPNPETVAAAAMRWVRAPDAPAYRVVDVKPRDIAPWLRGAGSAYPMAFTFTDDDEARRPWWRRIFR